MSLFYVHHSFISGSNNGDNNVLLIDIVFFMMGFFSCPPRGTNNGN
jgi:hypothetical protein